jgi:GNAT superfamily N-acetyltransferase
MFMPNSLEATGQSEPHSTPAAILSPTNLSVLISKSAVWAPKMAIVEREVWDERHAASEFIIRGRLTANPGCTLGAFDNQRNNMVGFLTLVRVARSQITPIRSWDYYSEISRYPWKEGDVLYCISLTVSNHAPRGTGTLLMKGLIEYARALGARTVIAVTRAPGYHRVAKEVSFAEYYDQLLQGERREPLFHLMRAAGYAPWGYQENYYSDEDSADYGIHFEVSV